MTISDSLGYRFADPKEFSVPENHLLDTLATRASCRDYADRPVDPELLRTLCALTLCSPSKSDLQQRDIIILEDATQRNRITGLFPDGDWARSAPCFLVFCGNNRRQRQLHERHNVAFANDHLDAFFNAAVDAAIAIGVFVTAAESVGLGCCPVSALRNHCEGVSKILGLPDHVFPVAGMGVGWPAKKGTISPRLPLSATLHLDRFNDADILSDIESYDGYRQQHQPYERQLHADRFGESEDYGWSQDKARQYSVSQRVDFGRFVRNKGFSLD